MTFLSFIKQHIPMGAGDEQAFRGVLVEKKIDAGNIYIPAGEICRHIYFLESGKVRSSFVDPRGQEYIWNFHFNEAVSRFENFFPFDYLSFLAQTPTHLDFMVEEDAVFTLLPYKQLESLFRLGKAYEEIGRIMTQQAYQSVHQRSFSLLTKSAESRYKELLEVEPHLLQMFPQYQVAKYLGMQPESLSRIRAKISS